MSRFASFLVAILSCVYYAQLAPTETYPHSVSLASNYMLYWKYNSTHITFETHVDAQGYTGFGISKNGSMFPGDVVIGYVSHNKPHLTDYYTDMHAPPKVDNSQDWVLLDGMKDHGTTILKFTRALDTQDSNDVPIHAGLTHVIWSFTNSDPANLTYHDAHRGSKDIRLIEKGTIPVGK